MIEKMKFLNISGPKGDIDRMCSTYLSKYEIQLENAATELKTTQNLLPFVDANPYTDPLAKANQFVGMLDDVKEPAKCTLSEDDMLLMIRNLNHDYQEAQEERDKLKKKQDDFKNELNVLKSFTPVDVEIHKVLHYHFIKVRFGRIPTASYEKLQKYLMDDMDVIFLEGDKDEDNVYGCYFAANADIGEVDAAFKSMNFETITISDTYKGTPAQACDLLNQEIDETEKQIEEKDKDITDMLNKHASDLLGARDRLSELAEDFDIRKMAARVQDKGSKSETYLLCGWMSAKDADAFIEEAKRDDKVTVTVEEDSDSYFEEPPTKLKNPRFFKPFQMFTEMYGMPSYDEMDPTIFVAITYTFIFGSMFGDVGQGLVLFIGGGILYLTRRMALAGIISIAGVFSTFFGFMYGSFFGFENVIKAVWLKPISAMTKLPFVGQLNTVFVVSIAFGMGLNLLVMIFQIINAAKKHDTENLWFSKNGVAGFVFYGFLVLTIVLYMTGHKTPGNILLVIFLGGPVLVFLFREPLTNLVKRNHKKIEEGRVMFIVEGIFDLIETMLSYFSNTLSFVRIGAFAISHGAMMEVVLMLSGAEAGHPNWLVVVIGNIIVMGMEGLVVGIQVLRLEYYELFSRYYDGGGRKFTPFHNIDKKKRKAK